MAIERFPTASHGCPKATGNFSFKKERMAFPLDEKFPLYGRRNIIRKVINDYYFVFSLRVRLFLISSWLLALASYSFADFDRSTDWFIYPVLSSSCSTHTTKRVLAYVIFPALFTEL